MLKKNELSETRKEIRKLIARPEKCDESPERRGCCDEYLDDSAYAKGGFYEKFCAARKRNKCQK